MALKGFPVESGSSAVFRMDSPHTAKQETPRLRNRPVPPEFSGRSVASAAPTHVCHL